MALLAARLGVLFVMHRPEPERILAMRLLHRRGGAAIAAVAGRAAELLRIMMLHEIFVRVADEERVAPHVLFRERERLARAQVAGLAAIHDVRGGHVDLLDLVSEVLHLAD